MTAPFSLPPPVPGIDLAELVGPRVRVSRLPAIGWAGLALLGAFTLAALLGPALTPYRVTELAGNPLERPSGAHLVGTNALGQDLATQLLSGVRASLFVALVAGGATVLIGGLIGMVAGWRGGALDAAMMRLVDLVLIIPKTPLLIMVAAYGASGLVAVSLIIALTSWPSMARLVRAQVLSLRSRAHLKAAVGFGSSTARVLRRHIVPELGLILMAGLVAAAGRAITYEAALSFLGVGDPMRASWGSILRDALRYSGLFSSGAWAWWLLPPVIGVGLLLLGVTLLGMAVEQRINPKLTRHRVKRGR